jgi:hypothetical protein
MPKQQPGLRRAACRECLSATGSLAQFLLEWMASLPRGLQLVVAASDAAAGQDGGLGNPRQPASSLGAAARLLPAAQRVPLATRLEVRRLPALSTGP